MANMYERMENYFIVKSYSYISAKAFWERHPGKAIKIRDTYDIPTGTCDVMVDESMRDEWNNWTEIHKTKTEQAKDKIVEKANRDIKLIQTIEKELHEEREKRENAEERANKAEDENKKLKAFIEMMGLTDMMEQFA